MPDWTNEEFNKMGYMSCFEDDDTSEDLSFLSEMGMRAGEKVVREFDSRVVAGRYRELYQEVLSG